MFIIRDTDTGQLSIRVWQQQQGKTFVVDERSDVASYTPSRAKGAPTVVTFADGESWEIVKAGGCACGSPLRRITWRTEPKEA